MCSQKHLVYKGIHALNPHVMSVLSFAMSGPVSVKLDASRPHWVVFRDYSSVNGNHFGYKKRPFEISEGVH